MLVTTKIGNREIKVNLMPPDMAIAYSLEFIDSEKVFKIKYLEKRKGELLTINYDSKGVRTVKSNKTIPTGFNFLDNYGLINQSYAGSESDTFVETKINT